MRISCQSKEAEGKHLLHRFTGRSQLNLEQRQDWQVHSTLTELREKREPKKKPENIKDIKMPFSNL